MSDERDRDGRRAAHDVERLVFFSDAVVAIAITLLVIDLRLPEVGPYVSDDALRAALGESGARIFSVVLSFLVIGLWWTSHHRLFGVVARLDGMLVILNLAFLGAIAFLPFPTSIIGRSTLPTAVALYATTNAFIGFMLVAMRYRVDAAGLLDPAVPLGPFRERTRRTIITPAVFAVSVPLAYLSPVLAAWSWNLVWILVLVVRRWRGPGGPN